MRAIAVALAVALAGASAAQAATGAVILRPVAVGGEHAPGTPPDVSFFGALEVDAGTPPHIDRDGSVGFGAFLAGPGVEANDMGIWVERGGALTLVMRNGGQAPGLPPGVTFATTGFFPLVPAVAAGRTAFFSIVSGPARGLWKETDGGKETGCGLALVHLGGTQAPGLAPGIALQLVFSPFLDDAGQVSFFGALSGSGVNRGNDESIWSDRSGVLGLVVREGQAAPGTDAVFGAGSYPFAPPRRPARLHLQ